jgi:ADP-ribosylglycohydrolase/predicted NAD-dependent protein-ADP-ribosyltransferase YbiA (DUF1768 family)
MRKSKIQYNPTLSVKDNAKRNGVSEAAIRYYIKVNNIDRRFDRTQNLIADCRNYLKEHPNATRAELAKETGHGINTIRRYWDAAHERASIEQFKNDSKKKFTRTRLDNAVKDPSKIANGKPLASELLKEASDIIKFAEQADTGRFREWLLRDRIRPLICLGNGGKHTTFPALLYQMMSSIGKSATPLEFATMSPEAISNSKVLILSNGGANPDIKYATKRAAKYNKNNTACFTFTDTDDNIMVKTFGLEQSFVFKNDFYDGFISIRSKILTYALLYKAFSGDTSFADKIRGIGQYKVEINKKGSLPRWSNINHFNVLYGSYGEPVAHDIESTMVEGGIASVQLTDYRNFCHGRFIFGSNHCANKKVKTTDVCTILLISPREEKIAREIREKALPDNMPIVEIRTELDNPLATIQLLIDALTFVFNVAERCFDINPNSPKNYSAIDKRIPKNSIPFAQELSRLGELHYDDGAEPIPPAITTKAVVGDLKTKAKIDELLAIEKENTAALASNPSYLPTPTKQDLYKKEQYDASKHYCVAFRRKEDLWKDMPVPFGNMNGGYPYTMHGITFPSSEQAYIFGIFSNNTPEHIELQKQVLEANGGFNAKRFVRLTNAEMQREDWEEFNVEWMLYCVWRKACQCSEFKKSLMAIPEGATIIEDVSFQNKKKQAGTSSFWGAKNPDKTTFEKLVEKYVKSLGLKKGKAADDAENAFLWEYCNVGIYTGNNVMGKILTMVKQCLHDGTEPDINYDLLKSKNIHFLGKPIDFDAIKNGYIRETRCDYPEGELIKTICGGVFGDISGSTREKSSKSVYHTEFDLFPVKSRPTDDSVLTVAIADWLLHKDTLTLSETLKKWGRKYPKAGYGGGFRDYFKKNIEYSSDKNGAAMRVSPVAVIAKSLDEALSLAKETALPTHNTKEGIKGAQAIAAAIFLVRDGVSKGKDDITIKSEIKDFVQKKFGYDLNQTVESIRERSQRFAEMKRIHNDTGYEDPEFKPMSDAATSVPMAIVAFLEGNSYEEVLRIAISLGGDADTIACMASSISVHLYGVPQGLYEDGRKLIPDEMKAIIDEFDAKYLTNN